MPKTCPVGPTFVLRDLRIAIFVDGDFWHGWRFPVWRLKLLSEKWGTEDPGEQRAVTSGTSGLLRRAGFRKVIRLWEHQIKKSPEPTSCLARILAVKRR